MLPAEAKSTLQKTRAAFRARMAEAGAAQVWQGFRGRIAAVLSGGGARGAYEAGVLLAFQDAQLPTHIITASSVGSINAASYAANSKTVLGNAEGLVETWLGLTPVAVGIEWTRYAWTLGGLVAATAGFGNLIRHLMSESGLSLHLRNPALTWFALGLAGAAVLLFFDHLPYLGYVLASRVRPRAWKPDRKKTMLSLAGNLVVWSFVVVVLQSLHIPGQVAAFFRTQPLIAGAVVAALLALVVLRNRWLTPLNLALHRVLRLPLRAGLFANFERIRLLRQRFSSEQIRSSPIRVIFTLTELESGTARFFSNAKPEELAADPGADARFVAEEVATTDDLMQAVIASSALPIVYEPMKLSGRLYADGGIVTNQPIRPAVRLGADVLFLVIVDAPGNQRGEVRTFLDIGLRALNILMMQSLLTDLKILNSVNVLCERAGAELKLRPEEIEVDFGPRRYRYAKPFIIRPEEPLRATPLDFYPEMIGPAVLQGYLDACAQIEAFLAYAPETKFGRPKVLLHYAPVRREV